MEHKLSSHSVEVIYDSWVKTFPNLIQKPWKDLHPEEQDMVASRVADMVAALDVERAVRRVRGLAMRGDSVDRTGGSNG